MTRRAEILRTLAAAVAGLALCVSVFGVAYSWLIRLDVREEMASTLESIHTELDYNFEYILESMTMMVARAIDEPANVDKAFLDGLRESLDLDCLRVYRKPDATVAVSGAATVLHWMRQDFPDGVHALELGVNFERLSHGPLCRILMTNFCRKWPSTCDGYPICLHEPTGRILSSGFREAKSDARLAEVFADPSILKSVKPETFFETIVYGKESICILTHRFDFTFVVVVPFQFLHQYIIAPIVSAAIVLLVMVVVFTILSLKRSALLGRLRYYIDSEKVRMTEDLAAAKLVQVSALPPSFPPQPAFRIRARMDPAKVVGGDFYDYQTMPNGSLYFLVADVSGKGISAAMFMMRAKSVIKQCLSDTHDLAKGMTAANAVLAAHNDSKLFVTVWVGILEPRTGVVRYVNAGHNPPLVRRGGETVATEWVRCPPSLVMALLPDVTYPVHHLTLNPGDTLLLYTDGATEAQNGKGGLYGEARLEHVVRTGAEDIVSAVRADVDAFQGAAEPADDVTLVSIDYTGTPPGAARGFPCTREVGFVESVQFVESELIRQSCPNKMRTQFLIAYDEIASNVVNYSGAPFFTVKVAFEATPPAFTLTVTDTGKAFNPLEKSAPDLALSFERRVSGGYGIFITRRLMDDVIYSRDEGRNVLTLRMKLRSE